MKHSIFSASVVLALTLSSAHAADNMIEVIEPAQAEKIAIVVTPEAYARMAAEAASAHKAGQDNWIAINLMVGIPSAIRAEAFVYTGENMKVAVEGIYGAEVLSPAYGGGVRVQFRVAGGAKNALFISPGVDIIVSPPDSSFLGHYATYYFVTADADISWLHEFANHFGFELGLKLGGAVELREDGPHPVPQVGLFTGFRF